MSEDHSQPTEPNPEPASAQAPEFGSSDMGSRPESVMPRSKESASGAPPAPDGEKPVEGDGPEEGEKKEEQEEEKGEKKAEREEEEEEEEDAGPSYFPKAVLVFVVSFLACLFFLKYRIGSNDLPVSPYLFLIPFAGIALTVTLIALSIDTYWGLMIQIGLILVSIFLSNHVYMFHFKNALNHAKEYGEQIGNGINLFHLREGQWPNSIKRLSADLKPEFNPKSIAPYLCIYNEELEYFSKVGGMNIVYKSDEKFPQLFIGQNKKLFTWNWASLTWEKGSVD